MERITYARGDKTEIKVKELLFKNPKEISSIKAIVMKGLNLNVRLKTFHACNLNITFKDTEKCDNIMEYLTAVPPNYAWRSGSSDQWCDYENHLNIQNWYEISDGLDVSEKVKLLMKNIETSVAECFENLINHLSRTFQKW